MKEITLAIVLTTAAVDAINPCAIGVLLLLLQVLLKNSGNKKFMLKLSSLYIGVVFFVYLLSGFGLVWLQSKLVSLGFGKIIGIFVGIVVIVGALIEIKDFFWYGKGISLSIPKKYAKRIQERMEHLTTWGMIPLGAFVAMVELPCTGGPYLAITAIIAQQFDLAAVLYLVLYNIIFVLPLIVIACLAFWGTKLEVMKTWKDEKKKWMRLAMGLVMLGLGLFILYYYVTF